MQMVMMVFRTSLESDVLSLVEEEQLPFTRLDGVQGKGATGSVPGAVTWGGSNTVLLLAVPDDRDRQALQRRLATPETARP